MIKKQNQTQLRANNRALVLETIVRMQPVSRADLSRVTLLNKVTVSDIVAELLGEKLIEEIGTAESSGGRRPTLLQQNREAGIALAVNVAPNELNILASWLDGTPIDRERSMHFSPERSEIIPALTEVIGDTLDTLPVKVAMPVSESEVDNLAIESGYPLIGIAFAIHGNVYNDEILFTPYYDMSRLDLAGEMRKRFSCPIYVGNEANYSALGELGVGSVSANSIVLSIHSGIGAGIIRNAQLVVGQRGFAGEVGHTIVVPDGLLCPCGNQGCVEQYASDQAIIRLFREMTDNTNATMRDLIEDIQNETPTALLCAEQFIKYLSILVNNLTRTFDPDKIIINSRLTSAVPKLVGAIETRQFSRLSKAARVESSLLGDPAILFGGLYKVIVSFYGIQRLRFASF